MPLAGSPLLARARCLGFALGSPLRVTGWTALAMPKLRELALSSVALGPSDSTDSLPHMSELRRLSIRDCRLNKGVVEGLAAMCGPLAELDVTAGKLGARLGDIAGGFPSLTSLQLAGNALGSAGLARLLPALANAVVVDLRGNGLVPADVPALLAAMPRVVVLELGGNALGDDGAAQLAAWPGAAHLERLHLGNAGVTSTGARSLAASPHLANLRSLVLSGKRFDPATEAALVGSPHLASARIYGGDRFLARAT